MQRIILFFLFMLFPFYIAAEQGTLIVTYQSGNHGERLDRIRFWLKNEEGNSFFYPKNEGFFEDDTSLSRKVVIEHLPAGNYILSFALPNYDHFFEPLPPRYVTIQPGNVTKVEQHIKIIEKLSPPVVKSSLQEPLPGLIAQNIFYPYNRPTSVTTFPKSGVSVYNYSPYYNDGFFDATFKVNSTLSDANWEIFSGPYLVQSGRGTSTYGSIRPYAPYVVRAEQKEGYSAYIFPETFTPSPGETININIDYRATRGKIELQASLPQGEAIQLTVKSMAFQTNPMTIPLRSLNGQVNWRSYSLPTGRYTVSYTLPAYFIPIPPQVVIVKDNQITYLAPRFIPGRTLTVQTNNPNAIFTLTSSDRSISPQQGSGASYTFQHLMPGRYTVTYSTSDPNKFLPPEPQSVEVTAQKNAVLNADFRSIGVLTVTTNVPNVPVNISSIRGPKYNASEVIPQGGRSFNLPEGTYRIYFYPPRGEARIEFAGKKPDPIDVDVIPGREAVVNGEYSNAVPPVPTPEPLQKREKPLEDKQEPTSENTEEVEDPILSIPAGESIIGDLQKKGGPDEQPARRVFIDAFKISKYEVTNAEFIAWLNEALQKDEVVYASSSGGQAGIVFDKKGNPICKTFDAASYSQIMFSSSFYPLLGKENYPVIGVTWFGAKAYCEAKGGRLPSEAEWEKVAGMAITKPGEALVKYEYGTGSDTVNRQMANYKDNDSPLISDRVSTSPVGYYNGKNTLPLRIGDTTSLTTEDTHSPYGAYDMSGNVWEWVNDWYSEDAFAHMTERNPTGPSEGTQRVAKGGCYDSLEEGIRVAERLPLDPQHSDQFTGFRIAF